MFKRKPHADLAIINGMQFRSVDQSAKHYLEMQKKMARFYLNGFLCIVEEQKKNGKLLEIGSGPGYQTVEIIKRFPGAQVTALEPSSDMIKVATAYSQSQGTNNRLTFVKGAVEDNSLIQGLGTFDLIYSTFSLHHWQEPVKAMRNLYGALKTGGVILIYDFERHWLTYYLPIRKGLAESIRASYTPKEIASMLSAIDVKHYHVHRHFPYLSIVLMKGGNHAKSENS
jgi:ubiquinone/menaquinone biosynthesis C-methylase UbiE